MGDIIKAPRKDADLLREWRERGERIEEARAENARLQKILATEREYARKVQERIDRAVEALATKEPT